MLTAWFLATVVAQLPRLKLTNSLSRVPLIPRWSFFAPTPGTSDVLLFYRNKLGSGTCTIWTEAYRSRRGSFCWIWNPERRMRKALFDLSQAICRTIQANGAHQVLTVSYLLVLSIVSSEPHWPGARYVQFALIARTRGGPKDELEEIFRSRFHTI
jgi:hypothetical protein